MIARVFPRRTKATPRDEYSFIGDPPRLALPDGIDEVHVSATFSWDLREAERLVRAWEVIRVPVKLGGPATGMRGEEFVPGRYLAPGYVITSRGCPKHCWFCSVHQRDGATRELPIRDGYNVLDDNLLACSEDHVDAVFKMLARQRKRAEFTGGIDAALLQTWHAERIVALHPQSVFFAYDTPDDWPHVRRAVELLIQVGMKTAGKRIRCYVLFGYEGDTPADAAERMRRVLSLGAVPFAMRYRGADWKSRGGSEWDGIEKKWIRPALIRMPF